MVYSKTKPEYPWYLQRGEFVIVQEPGTILPHRGEIINAGRGKDMDMWQLHLDGADKPRWFPKAWCHDPETWTGAKLTVKPPRVHTPRITKT